MVAMLELFHHNRKAATLSLTCQEGGGNGLVIFDFLPIIEEPNHAGIFGGREEFLIVLLTNSEISVFALLATTLGVDELLLKIHSFLASHNFH